MRVVLTRIAILIALPLSLCACANEGPQVGGFSMSTSALAIGQPPADANLAATESSRKKTMADKVLAAIALERVTGLKPDPARFME